VIVGELPQGTPRKNHEKHRVESMPLAQFEAFEAFFGA
jgi:hypothetical protein